MLWGDRRLNFVEHLLQLGSQILFFSISMHSLLLTFAAKVSVSQQFCLTVLHVKMQ